MLRVPIPGMLFQMEASSSLKEGFEPFESRMVPATIDSLPHAKHFMIEFFSNKHPITLLNYQGVFCHAFDVVHWDSVYHRISRNRASETSQS